MALPSVGGGYQLGDGNLNEVTIGDQGTVTALTGAANTLTAAQATSGIITVASGGAGASVVTVPTGAQLDALLTNAKIGSTFDVSIINISTTSGDVVNLAVNTGVTFVGNVYLAINSASAAAVTSGIFRFVRTAAATWVVYRVA